MALLLQVNAELDACVVRPCDCIHACSVQLLENLPADPRRHLKIDVYSFGVTLWEMLSRQRPHSDIHPFQLQVPMSAMSRESLVNLPLPAL